MATVSGGVGDDRNSGAGNPGISRRTMLIGGGAGAGLLIAWGIWPRHYAPNLVAVQGEHVLHAFLKIGTDGHVAVVVPQAEMGQGVYTALPQILADELGADWRTVGVEPAPVGPLYANELLVAEGVEGALPAGLRTIGGWAARQVAIRASLAMTGGSTSIRAFEDRFREAGAIARTLLCMAAADRWNVDPTVCDTADGFVVSGQERLRFGELAAAAAALAPPGDIVLRGAMPPRSPPRLDMPAKIDGTARYAADVRLPDMVYASLRHGPHGDTRLAGVDNAAADRIPGMLAVVENPGWVAAVATNWWAANRALDAMRPRFATKGPLPDSASIDAALSAALAEEGTRFTEIGDVEAVFAEGGGITAEYSVPLAVHAAIEPMAATARISGDRLEVWMPTQAAGIARAAAARAIGFDEDAVTIYPMLLGGSFGRKIETEAAEQAAILALRMKRPVQLMWSRGEDIARDRFRPPARGRMAARMRRDGRLLGWRARIAAPPTFAELSARLMPGTGGGSGAEAAAVEGAVPAYAIPAIAIDHHPADIGVSTGMWRSVAHSYTAFFTECFVDELAHVANVEPLSFRMQMLGGSRRLAHCLSTVTALGGWEGGVPGSGQGIAAHSAFGSHVAMLAEVHVDGAGQVVVDRIVAVVDCGRTINDDIVLQQIEGGILWGMAAALGATTGFTRGLADIRNFDALGLPILATTPEIVVRIVRSSEPPGGVGELAVPPVAPAIANALFAVTGRRYRSLPLSIRS
ncbi:MAG: isoquinoline 1-oxidoreductase [Sphingomonas bacterium]|nr:molybdopterin cofactor-binding domain-containing protein [Sphingomonas bacterium]MDB5689381.1 isoquinoline 1-oxidoreductase [Sphingomonas bacterium]